MPKGTHIHHWLLHRNQGLGKYFPEWFKDQPWNLRPVYATAENSYLKYSRHRAGHVRIYAPDYFGYDENISDFREKVNKLRDLYTGKVLYDFNVFERSEFQKVIQIIENRSDEKCIRKLVLAAHGKASPKDESDFEASMEFGIESLTETNISDMFKGIKFCSPCHIELRVCHIEKSQQLKNSLIEKYPCTITIYDTYVKP